MSQQVQVPVFDPGNTLFPDQPPTPVQFLAANVDQSPWGPFVLLTIRDCGTSLSLKLDRDSAIQLAGQVRRAAQSLPAASGLITPASGLIVPGEG